MAKKRAATQRGTSKPGKMRMLIVEARYYDAIADKLLEGARGVLNEAGVEYDVVTVPGALEIPAAIAMACEARQASGLKSCGTEFLSRCANGAQKSQNYLAPFSSGLRI